MKIKDFSKSKIRLPLPYLLEVEKASWAEFWQRDLKELLEEVSPIRDYTGKWLELWLEDYKLGEPHYANEFEAKKQEDSYAAPFKILVKVVDLKTKEENTQEVFFGDFPLMTNRGTFVINGVERVVISQLLRSPGAFFTLRQIKGKKYFGARIIPNRGSWLEIETDPSGFIGVKIDRKRRVPATTLLRAFGVDSDDKIKSQFTDIDRGEINYISETLKRDTTNNQAEALVEIYKRLRPGDLASPDTAKELIENMFFNFERYDLSKVGRWKTLERLPELKVKNPKSKVPVKSKEINTGREITIEDRVLRVEDIVAVLREIIRLNNTPGSEADEIDHLGNRRVRTISELLKDRLRVGLARVERISKDRMTTLDTSELAPNKIINPRPFMAVIKQFFSSSQLSQFMDNENILAELEHKRRLTAGGPGGLTRKRAGLQVRDVQPSHYGRICPIQTPEGPNVGLVGHLAIYSRINPYGFIETPYFKVEKGRVTNNVHYLNAFEEEKYIIGNANIDVDSKGNILSEKIEGRDKGKPKIIDKKKLDFVDVAPEQFVSTATALIPFLQNDDANRALMGSNMQRQSVPLIRATKPLVGTGIEERVVKDSGKAVVAIEDGIVEEVDAQHVVVKTQEPKPKTQNYQLRNFDPTNQFTYFHHKPIVYKGQKVRAGDVLADPTGSDDGCLALGQNLLVAFLSWRGHNYEDAIILSSRVLEEELLSSIHIEILASDVRETKLGPEMTTADIPNVSEEKLKDLDSEGIVRVGAEIGPNDILVGKISPKGETDLTAEERLLWAIFGEKAKNVKDTSLIMEHGKKGRVVRVKEFSRDLGHRLQPGVIKRIQVEIAQLRKITVGDKLAGRHGNKGIVAKVLPKEEMPFMEDGTPVDIVLNPLGVISRMNIGQVLETHLGWAAHKLGYMAISPSLSGANEKDIKEELRKAGLPEDGKVMLYDGRTGQPFDQKITVGYVYMMRLIHMVEDKIHMRSIGPYSLITQQPLGGRAQFGGQRFGEMEVWALQGYGAAYALQEMLTIKSDDIIGRAAAYQAILKGRKIDSPHIPASFSLLMNELKALGLNVDLNEK